MHNTTLDPAIQSASFDIYLSEISKIEGSASLELKVRAGKIEDLKFSISEWKRFYTQAMRGKPAPAVPQLVARICGTCSNAHLLASIQTIENIFKITPSAQTQLLRKLFYYGLIIRDHGLHLYVFALPDLYGKNSLLDFDEGDPVQHQLLDDAFEVKEVGNLLSLVVGGRSVHAPYPTVGGFLKLPTLAEIKKLQEKLHSIRPKIIDLIEIFASCPFGFTLNLPITFSGLTSNDFSFLDGELQTSENKTISRQTIGEHLDAVIIPYSQARGFTFDGNLLMTGALARINLNRPHLHPRTQESAQAALKLFPSANLFHNNLAQAIEILHAVDATTDIIDQLTLIDNEKPVAVKTLAGTGVGVIEAPRGTLYYKIETDNRGMVVKGDIIVPTGQNQVLMEKAIYQLVEQLLVQGIGQEVIVAEIEKLIRAFDPCMSCAAHFLRVKWHH